MKYIKALLITSDPYEPSGVIGIFTTEEEKQAIIKECAKDFREEDLREIKIPFGKYGIYY